MSDKTPFLIYPPQMWRRHIVENFNMNIDFTPEYFGPIKTLYHEGRTLRLVQLAKNTLLYDIKNNQNFILNADNSNKFYVIDETYERLPTTINTRNIKLPSSFEGEIIGSLLFNSAQFNEIMLYNFRLCVNFFLYLYKEFPRSQQVGTNGADRPIGLKTDRSELISYTRTHYYQLAEIFPSLRKITIKEILDMEKKMSEGRDLTRELYKLYENDLNEY